MSDTIAPEIEFLVDRRAHIDKRSASRVKLDYLVSDSCDSEPQAISSLNIGLDAGSEVLLNRNKVQSTITTDSASFQVTATDSSGNLSIKTEKL